MEVQLARRCNLSVLFRAVAVFVALIFAASCLTQARAADCPGADTVKKAANAFVAAARNGSPSAFGSVLARYTDVNGLAMFALGKYRRDLPPDRQSEYVRNATVYMSRFLADNAGRFSGSAQLSVSSCKGN